MSDEKIDRKKVGRPRDDIETINVRVPKPLYEAVKDLIKSFKSAKRKAKEMGEKDEEEK